MKDAGVCPSTSHLPDHAMPWAFKGAGGQDDTRGGSQARTQPKSVSELSPAILCRQCRQAVTSTDARISVDGTHRHVFANPHGLVFEIGCFARVVNCHASGPATDEFTWFAGHTWQVVLCAACLVHLGWRFDAPADRFFGLITARLIEPA